MDPNATLNLIRDAIANGQYGNAGDLFGDLDDWLIRGGYPPKAWTGGDLKTERAVVGVLSSMLIAAGMRPETVEMVVRETRGLAT